jgi:hypothetical protein
MKSNMVRLGAWLAMTCAIWQLCSISRGDRAGGVDRPLNGLTDKSAPVDTTYDRAPEQSRIPQDMSRETGIVGETYYFHDATSGELMTVVGTWLSLSKSLLSEREIALSSVEAARSTNTGTASAFARDPEHTSILAEADGYCSAIINCSTAAGPAIHVPMERLLPVTWTIALDTPLTTVGDALLRVDSRPVPGDHPAGSVYRSRLGHHYRVYDGVFRVSPSDGGVQWVHPEKVWLGLSPFGNAAPSWKANWVEVSPPAVVTFELLKQHLLKVRVLGQHSGSVWLKERSGSHHVAELDSMGECCLSLDDVDDGIHSVGGTGRTWVAGPVPVEVRGKQAFPLQLDLEVRPSRSSRLRISPPIDEDALEVVAWSGDKFSEFLGAIPTSSGLALIADDQDLLLCGLSTEVVEASVTVRYPQGLAFRSLFVNSDDIDVTFGQFQKAKASNGAVFARSIANTHGTRGVWFSIKIHADRVGGGVALVHALHLDFLSGPDPLDDASWLIKAAVDLFGFTARIVAETEGRLLGSEVVSWK